jgi:hypothetical protein
MSKMIQPGIFLKIPILAKTKFGSEDIPIWEESSARINSFCWKFSGL